MTTSIRYAILSACLFVLLLFFQSTGHCQAIENRVDEIIIEQVRIPRPDKYQPGDMLIPKQDFNTILGMAKAYREIIASRPAVRLQLDSLYQANQMLQTEIDSVRKVLNQSLTELDQKSQKLSEEILKQDRENLELLSEAQRGYKEIKKQEKKGRSFVYGRWDRPTRNALYIGGGATLTATILSIIFL